MIHSTSTLFKESPMTTVRALSDRLHGALCAADPFDASVRGIRGFDDRVPDPSPEARGRLCQELQDIGRVASSIEWPADLDEQLSLMAVRETVEGRLAE